MITARETQQWFRVHNCRGVLADLDDTFLATDSLFKTSIQAYISFVCNYSQSLEETNFSTTFTTISNTLLKSPLSVRPKRWEYVVTEISALYPGYNAISQGLPLLMQIYQETPSLLPGALETLDTLKEAGVPVAFVTHADPAWTNLKIDAYQLDNYGPVIVVDPQTEPAKQPYHWRTAAHTIRVPPAQCIGVGDSVTGDIRNLLLAGVPVTHLYHVLPAWSQYGTGELPVGTRQIKSIADFLPAICSSTGTRQSSLSIT